LIDDCRAHGAGHVRAAVTEWNLWRRASHYDGQGFLEPYDVTHGLYVAAALNHFCRLAPEMELANFYNLLNLMGLWISRGATVQAAPAADVFRLYRPTLPGEWQTLDQGPERGPRGCRRRTPCVAQPCRALAAGGQRDPTRAQPVVGRIRLQAAAHAHRRYAGGRIISEHLAWRGGRLLLRRCTWWRLWAVGPEGELACWRGRYSGREGQWPDRV
jgi:hypothetical protein